MKSFTSPCNYSFKDLTTAAKEPDSIFNFKEQSREQINGIVKRLCEKAGWNYKDIIGNNGVVFTAFSPYIIR